MIINVNSLCSLFIDPECHYSVVGLFYFLLTVIQIHLLLAAVCLFFAVDIHFKIDSAPQAAVIYTADMCTCVFGKIR